MPKSQDAERWLGKPCRDKVTGFYGIATGVAYYHYTTPQVQIESRTPTGDAKSRWVNEARVEDMQDEDLPGIYT